MERRAVCRCTVRVARSSEGDKAEDRRKRAQKFPKNLSPGYADCRCPVRVARSSEEGKAEDRRKELRTFPMETIPRVSAELLGSKSPRRGSAGLEGEQKEIEGRIMSDARARMDIEK